MTPIPVKLRIIKDDIIGDIFCYIYQNDYQKYESERFIIPNKLPYKQKGELLQIKRNEFVKWFFK